MSKAWAYTTTNGDDWVVVFADGETEARELVFHQLRGALEMDEIEVGRLSEIDYLDRPNGYVMDWNHIDDRLALVKTGDWWCIPDPDFRCTDCIVCPAKEYCQAYNEDLHCNRLQGDWCKGCKLYGRENG